MNIVLKNGTGEIEEKKSRFIAHVYNVSCDEEAEQYINAVKKKYWDARQVVTDGGKYSNAIRR